MLCGVVEYNWNTSGEKVVCSGIKWYNLWITYINLNLISLELWFLLLLCLLANTVQA